MTERWIVLLSWGTYAPADDRSISEPLGSGPYHIVCNTRKAADEILKRLGGADDFIVQDFAP